MHSAAVEKQDVPSNMQLQRLLRVRPTTLTFVSRLWHGGLIIHGLLAHVAESRDVSVRHGQDLSSLEGNDVSSSPVWNEHRVFLKPPTPNHSREISVPPSIDDHGRSAISRESQELRKPPLHLKRVPVPAEPPPSPHLSPLSSFSSDSEDDEISVDWSSDGYSKKPMTDNIEEAAARAYSYLSDLDPVVDAPPQINYFSYSDLANNGWNTNEIATADIPRDLTSAFDALGLSQTRSDNPLWCSDQDRAGKTSSGSEFTRTDAQYHSHINAEEGVIVTTRIITPEDIRRTFVLSGIPLQPPPLSRFSDILELQWRQAIATKIPKYYSGIKVWFFHQIVDELTKKIMDDILSGEGKTTEGPGTWPGLRYNLLEGDSYGMAFLGSPMGYALTHTISRHKSTFPRPYIPSAVHFFVSHTTDGSNARASNLCFLLIVG